MLNGKFRCVESSCSDSMTVGEIYEFVNGYVVWESGRQCRNPYYSLEDFHSKRLHLIDIKIEPIEELVDVVIGVSSIYENDKYRLVWCYNEDYKKDNNYSEITIDNNKLNRLELESVRFTIFSEEALDNAKQACKVYGFNLVEKDDKKEIKDQINKLEEELNNLKKML